jgi:hypothetical protein
VQGGSPSVARPARQGLEVTDPRYGGATPDLPRRLEPVALTDAAPANSPIVGTALTAGKKRGTAIAAEVLKAGPAIVAGLGVDFRGLTRHPDLLSRADHRHAVGRSGQHLTIRAVADRHPRRIDLGLIGHSAAMASPVYVHRSPPIWPNHTQKNGARRRRFIISRWGSFSAPSGHRRLRRRRPA